MAVLEIEENEANKPNKIRMKELGNECIVHKYHVQPPDPNTVTFFPLGELHVPLEVCGAVVKRELDFWQITELEIKACCWRHYRSYIENQNILNQFNHSLRSQAVEVDLDELKGWKRLQWQVWMVLEFPRTSRLAMIYGVTSFLFVVTSIAGFCLETLPQLKPKFLNVTMECEEGQEVGKQVMSSHEALNTLDIICTIFFTLELILRFTFAPEKLKFVRSLMNIIDLLALVPLYVTVLVYAIKASIQELLMLFIFLLIGMLIFSTMIYYAERKNATEGGDNFPTIPMGFWWSIITMTTVGYGDVYPTTPVGYIVGTACSVCGVLLVALTIPVISNNFTLFYRHVQSRTAIPKTQGGDDADDEGSDRDSGSGSWFGRRRFQGGKNGSKESKKDARRRKNRKGYSRSGSQLDRLSVTSSRRSSTSVSNLVAYMNGHAGAGTRLIRGSSGRPPPHDHDHHDHHHHDHHHHDHHHHDHHHHDHHDHDHDHRPQISVRLKKSSDAANLDDFASASTKNNSTSSNLKKSTSDNTFTRGRFFRAYSDDGVMYKGESIV
ncbi:potassium voltage-gated channel subfamily C member 1 [Elysia marginata]|uniref:Potassium voltage-gated channel subfamily C member 1 n=1 Tax=Elysia marginata TaxID=1093978 RepID=A0AAV4FQ64_9GAST|nr:potassium voltage-gated channel subfamily C member 1 [Elysia marginata]